MKSSLYFKEKTTLLISNKTRLTFGVSTQSVREKTVLESDLSKRVSLDDVNDDKNQFRFRTFLSSIPKLVQRIRRTHLFRSRLSTVSRTWTSVFYACETFFFFLPLFSHKEPPRRIKGVTKRERVAREILAICTSFLGQAQLRYVNKRRELRTVRDARACSLNGYRKLRGVDGEGHDRQRHGRAKHVRKHVSSAVLHVCVSAARAFIAGRPRPWSKRRRAPT